MKTDTDTIEINSAKTFASSEKYFALFDKYIANTYNENNTVLLYDICNEGCIELIVNKNPMATYVIYDCQEMKDILPVLIPGVKFIFINNKYDNVDLDKQFEYNLSGMKFDCIIMNPPYQRNLHLKILEKAIEHLKDDNSVCVNLSPTAWLSKANINRPFGKNRKTFNGYINDIEFINHETANSLFRTGNSIEELGIYTLNGNKSSSLDIEKYGFENDAEYKLYKKIDMINPKAGVITFNKAALDINYGRVSAKTAYCNKDTNIIDIRKPFDVPVYTWHGGKTCRDAVVVTRNDKKISMVLYFNTENEKTNFLNSLDTTFMNWYYYTFVVPGDYKLINYMFRMADYSEPWTDERFYKFFGITSDEQKIIENTVAMNN